MAMPLTRQVLFVGPPGFERQLYGKALQDAGFRVTYRFQSDRREIERRPARESVVLNGSRDPQPLLRLLAELHEFEVTKERRIVLIVPRRLVLRRRVEILGARPLETPAPPEALVRLLKL
ncbi:MAG TPA: hypothetical protein VHL09_05970 [Dehalococcoidia bacterium]|nr:hypothetical protein [Dehalococcoidia bacterium]